METSNKQAVLFRDLGNMEYQHAWDLQETLLKENVAVKTAIRNRQAAMAAVTSEGGVENEGIMPSTNHYLLFVEHPPVYTLGKSGDIANVLISEEERAAKGISFYYTNRGGDITFHGKEQLVGYPILDLDKFYTDLGRYLRSLEEVIILTMADYGLKGERSPGETGVWLDASIPGKERKICAMGIRCSRWITMHGFAFNINTDLTYFDYIIPCGIQNKQVTSLEKELGRKLDMKEVKEKVKQNFEKVFNVELTGS
ncbi:MAG: lipoyl(octanoyl) transferase LipB [Niastella sp.]|uniref:lipoyl(octanoyl) transferase LipB n=1 Tax=Niastella sp. TaxID=1869183 RepID=UPI003899E29C